MKTFGKKLGLFFLKLLVLFLLFDAVLRLAERPLFKDYEFKHKVDRLTWWTGDLDLKFRMHRISDPKAPGEFRIVLVGNSAVYGGGLVYEKTISSYLEKMLAGKSFKKGKPKVYNIGGGGAYTVDDFLLLEEALKYQPDLVIWGLTLRDFAVRCMAEGGITRSNFHRVAAAAPWLEERGYQDLYLMYLSSWLKTTTRLEQTQQKTKTFLLQYWYFYRYKEALREMFFDRLLQLSPGGMVRKIADNHRLEISVYNFAPPPFAEFEKNFTFPNPSVRFLWAIKELLDAQGVELMIYNQPTIFQDRTYPGNTLKKFFQFMEEQTPVLGVPYVNLADSLEADRENFYDFIHLTPRGNQQTAEHLAKKIMELYGNLNDCELKNRKSITHH